jgi:hypothetical protein
MKIVTTMMAIAGTAIQTSAAAAQTITWMPNDYIVLDLSEDGSAAAGYYIFDHHTFRWTTENGIELLGSNPVDYIGTTAGTPDISYDGTSVSASIINSDFTLKTQGIWTEGQGWITAMEQPGGDIVEIDNSLSSAWGLSGDGTSVCGFYWTDGASAQANTWSASGGLVPHPRTPGISTRTNALNYDGSIAVGWDRNSMGTWQPVVWRDNVRMRLSENEINSYCDAVNHDGSVVVGSATDGSILTRVATRWDWNGTSYDELYLGTLPDVPQGIGSSSAMSVTDDGSVITGWNRYSFSPGGPQTAFVWTQATGMIPAAEYLETVYGVDIDDNLHVRTALVSPDGSTFCIGGITIDELRYRYVIIDVSPDCTADTNGDGSVTPSDFTAWINAFNNNLPECDQNGDGNCTPTDFSAWIANFNAGC